jgi:hypothetical protein
MMLVLAYANIDSTHLLLSKTLGSLLFTFILTVWNLFIRRVDQHVRSVMMANCTGRSLGERMRNIEIPGPSGYVFK